MEYKKHEIRLFKDGLVIASILLDEYNKEYFYCIYFFKDKKLFRMEAYADNLFFVDYYITSKNDDGIYAKLTYKHYEVFVTASTWETLGLSVMEAIGSGAAVIGLDVKYGNRLFIHPEVNGYLIDYNYVDADDNKIVNDMAEKIVEIFSNKERLEVFHKNSCKIAMKFTSKIVAEKWKELLS